MRSVEVWLCYAAYASRHYQQEAATLSLLGELLVVKNRMPPCLRGMQARVWGSFGHVATPAARHGEAGSLLTEEEASLRSLRRR